LNIGRFLFHADVYTTHSQNEAFQPSPGLPETLLGAAERQGYDFDARYYFVKDAANNVAVFANYGEVVARLLDSAPSFYVPNVPLYTAPVRIGLRLFCWPPEHDAGWRADSLGIPACHRPRELFMA
jgi:hypothetical protein